MSKLTFNRMAVVFKSGMVSIERDLMPTDALGNALEAAVKSRPRGHFQFGTHGDVTYSIDMVDLTVMLFIERENPYTLAEVRRYQYEHSLSGPMAPGFMPDLCSDNDIQNKIDSNFRKRLPWDKDLALS